MDRLTQRGIKEISNKSRILYLIIHTTILYTSYTLCFSDGLIWISDLLGIDFIAGNIYRKIPIDELFGIITACAAYQIGFVLLGGWQSDLLNVLDFLGVLLFIIGSYFNTYSEIQRKRFKDDPNNKGKIYTEGLFQYARHINYFGDICWVTGWAIITHNLWSGIIPIMLTLGFIFFFIPELSNYLEKNYGDDYQDWSKGTKKLIPFIY